jgi:hypothetical protein
MSQRIKADKQIMLDIKVQRDLMLRNEKVRVQSAVVRGVVLS